VAGASGAELGIGVILVMVRHKSLLFVFCFILFNFWSLLATDSYFLEITQNLICFTCQFQLQTKPIPQFLGLLQFNCRWPIHGYGRFPVVKGRD